MSSFKLLYPISTHTTILTLNNRSQVGGLHSHSSTCRAVDHDDISSFCSVKADTPTNTPVQSGRGGERVQLHTRSGRVQQSQVDRLHRYLARRVCEGDGAPAFGDVIPTTSTSESVEFRGRERVQHHGCVGREDFADQIGRHVVPARAVCVVMVAAISCQNTVD